MDNGSITLVPYSPDMLIVEEIIPTFEIVETSEVPPTPWLQTLEDQIQSIWGRDYAYKNYRPAPMSMDAMLFGLLHDLAEDQL